MDGVRRWADNIERWFRNLKHDCICQTGYKDMRELRHVVSEYVEKYNFRRMHSSLDYAMPAEWYFIGLNAVQLPRRRGDEPSSMILFGKKELKASL